MIDPQFGVLSTLRPQANFVAQYQGVAANTLIMFTQQQPGGDSPPRDGLAGQTNYDEDLIRGLPVCIGQRVMLWLPKFGVVTSGGTTDVYAFRLIWRLRNLSDQNLAPDRSAAHVPLDRVGERDTTAPANNQNRVVIPAATETVVYDQSEPATLLTNVVQHARVEDLAMLGDEPWTGATENVLAPLIPAVSGAGTVTGVIQQGILDPGTYAPKATKYSYGVYETRAKGDELLIGLYRSTNLGGWNFLEGATDSPISDTLNSSIDLGIYVMLGVAP